MTLTEAQVLARRLMDEHGLKYWKLRFDRSKRRLGLCSRRRNLISLSAEFIPLNSEAVIKDTILHEIAHALVPPGSAHGREWKLMAIKVGARPVACQRLEEVVAPLMRYQAKCKLCGRTISRSQWPKGTLGCLCAKNKDLEQRLRSLLVWTDSKTGEQRINKLVPWPKIKLVEDGQLGLLDIGP